MTALQSSIDHVRIAARVANDLKGMHIQAIDVSEALGITDAFVLITATSARQVLAIAEDIEKALYLEADKLKPRNREGLDEGEWVLLDYGDFLVHIMIEEKRDFFGLEKLWADCPVIPLELEHIEEEA